MQRLEDVVIPMQPNFKDSVFYSGNAENLAKIREIPAITPFSEHIVGFLDTLARRLLKTGRTHPDVLTFAFWCRKASILQCKKNYSDFEHRRGRGVLFHIAPSNVPINFAFSLVVGLLAGNANIVRIPSKYFEQVDIILHAINELVQSDFSMLSEYICCISYPHDQAITDYLSLLSDTRIIWGGDTTIDTIRKSSLRPRATELTFANRYSIAVIDAQTYLEATHKEKVALNFYNDTYYSDQNACTSPRIVFWKGTDITEAQTLFWENLQKILDEKKYTLLPVQAVGKLTMQCLAAENDYAIFVERVHQKNDIIRVALRSVDGNIQQYMHHSGFFLEYKIHDLEEIVPICGEVCQTLSHFGLSQEEISCFLQKAEIKGIDRVVPMGQTMDFSLIWDGVDLMYALTRKITVLS